MLSKNLLTVAVKIISLLVIRLEMSRVKIMCWKLYYKNLGVRYMD